MTMHLKNGMKKHRFSSLFSWMWALFGLFVFICVHQWWFAPIFMEQFGGSSSPSRPLLLGACASYLLVCWLMLSGRQLPYANNFEVLLLTSLSTVSALLVFLAVGREFYSGTYLLVLFCLQTGWFGAEVYFRAHFVSYTFVVFPMSMPIAPEDFPEQKIVLLDSCVNPPQVEADAVVVDFNVKLDAEWLALLAKYQNSGIPIIPLNTLLENVWGRIPIELFTETIAFVDRPFRPYLIVKPLTDRVLALLGLLVALPILLVTVIVVKLKRQGPVLFLQERIGLHGVPFTIIKLRTMHNDPDGDRVTDIGRFLRKYHIDELPQLVNVLKGDMALVGPRPETSEFVAIYDQAIPGYCLRHRMLPGVVSWALIHQGNVSGIEDTRVKLSYDFFYLKHASCFLDFYIVLKTIWIMLFGIERMQSPDGLRLFRKKT